jgi:hypothetical protein
VGELVIGGDTVGVGVDKVGNGVGDAVTDGVTEAVGLIVGNGVLVGIGVGVTDAVGLADGVEFSRPALWDPPAPTATQPETAEILGIGELELFVVLFPNCPSAFSPHSYILLFLSKPPIKLLPASICCHCTPSVITSFG